MFQCIINQVDHGLLEGLAICADPSWLARTLALATGADVSLQPYLFLGCVWLHQAGGLLDDGRQVRWFQLVFFPTLIDACEIENVLDHAREATAVLEDE